MSKLDRSAHARNAKKTPRGSNPGDLPVILEKGDDTGDSLFAAVGKALSNWEHLENQLAFLFTVFVGGKVTRDLPAPAVRAYGTVMSFKGRAAMLQAAAKAYFLSRPDLGHAEQWSDMVKQLEGFSERRNDIAHGSVECSFDLDSEKKLGFFLMPGLYVSKKYPTGEPPKYQLTAEQVLRFAQCFADLAASVSHFRYVVLTKRRSSRRTPAPVPRP